MNQTAHHFRLYLKNWQLLLYAFLPGLALTVPGLLALHFRGEANLMLTLLGVVGVSGGRGLLPGLGPAGIPEQVLHLPVAGPARQHGAAEPADGRRPGVPDPGGGLPVAGLPDRGPHRRALPVRPGPEHRRAGHAGLQPDPAGAVYLPLLGLHLVPGVLVQLLPHQVPAGRRPRAGRPLPGSAHPVVAPGRRRPGRRPGPPGQPRPAPAPGGTPLLLHRRPEEHQQDGSLQARPAPPQEHPRGRKPARWRTHPLVSGSCRPGRCPRPPRAAPFWPRPPPPPS